MLKGKRVVFLVEEGFEDLEFWVTLMRLKEEEADVVIASPVGGTVYRGKNGLSASSQISVDEISAEQVDAVVIPGGWAPDRLRRDEAVKNLVRRAYKLGKIIGMICHAGHVGISAEIVRGHRATGSTAIKDDLENAGATWVDEAAFRDRQIVWGRVVADIPEFCKELVRAIAD